MELDGEVLWSPPSDVRETSTMGRFLVWVEERHAVRLETYEDFWRWSVADVARFWAAMAEYCNVKFHSPYTSVLRGAMPDVRWFEGATLNFAEHVLAGPLEKVVLISHSESRDPVRLTRAELRNRVAAVSRGLTALGVEPGDRVAAYLPNIPEAIIASIAAASIGAVWTSCPPEFGPRSVIDRLVQVAPKVLLAVDGYRYAGKAFDRAAELAEIRAALPTLQATVLLPYLDRTVAAPSDTVPWTSFESASGGDVEIRPVGFDHPLYILYSSGTTGKPKAIVHGHGGIVLEHLKWLHLHEDIGPADRYFWYSSTGWMAWNLGVSSLMCGSSLVTLDGALGYPDLPSLWKLLADERVTYLGTSPAFMRQCRDQDVVPGEVADLSALRGVMSGGAPLTAEGFRWVYRAINPEVYLTSGSGGTDVAGSFVAGTRLVPVRAGEIACRLLACDVHAFDEEGREAIGEQGELVVTQPMPSMPVGFWGDHDGSRLREAYFDRFPGVWCHGDWITITERGTAVVHGRSDATLNRGGVRLGTKEFYSVLDEFDELSDSLVVHLEDSEGDGMGQLVLFVSLRPGGQLDDELRRRIKSELRVKLSPRHVPDQIRTVPVIPRTTSGKLMEVPVKRILRGAKADEVASKGSMTDPECLTVFETILAGSPS